MCMCNRHLQPAMLSLQTSVIDNQHIDIFTTFASLVKWAQQHTLSAHGLLGGSHGTPLMATHGATPTVAGCSTPNTTRSARVRVEPAIKTRGSRWAFSCAQGHRSGWACQSLLDVQGRNRDDAASPCNFAHEGLFPCTPTLNILSSVAGVSSVVAQVIHSSTWCAGEAASAIR